MRVPDVPEVVATLAQVALASAAATGLCWLLITLFARHRPASLTRPVRFLRRGYAVGMLAPGTCLCLASRPPPAA